MSSAEQLRQLKHQLIQAGIEVYRTADHEIQVAERVRLHIMDSGIRVRLRDGWRVVFTARCQRRDFPSVDASTLFDRVREVIGQAAETRGYEEEESRTVPVTDPMDETKVLDTWHEVTYARAADDVGAIVEEIRWALQLEKYVGPAAATAAD